MGPPSCLIDHIRAAADDWSFVQCHRGGQTVSTIVSVTINLPDGVSTTAAVPAPDPSSWTKDDAKEFVWAVWRVLKAHAGESLQLREIDPARVVYRLEFVADTGSAVTEPLSLSMAALVFLQTLRFDLAPRGPVH